MAKPLEGHETSEERRTYQTPQTEVIRYEESDDVIMISAQPPECENDT